MNAGPVPPERSTHCLYARSVSLPRPASCWVRGPSGMPSKARHLASGQRLADAPERVLALKRREIGDQEADPRCSAGCPRRRSRGPARRAPADRRRAPAAARMRTRSPARAARRPVRLSRPGSGREWKPSSTARPSRTTRTPSARPGRRRAAPAGAGAARALGARGPARRRRVIGQRLAADRAALYEAVVAAEGRHVPASPRRCRCRDPRAVAGPLGPRRRPSARPARHPREPRAGNPADSGRPCGRTGVPR